MKPVIGIQLQVNMAEHNYLMDAPYVGLIRYAGGQPLLFPPVTTAEEAAQVVSMCDGLIIPGGDDIFAHLYGEEPLPTNDAPVCQRDLGEPLILDAVLAADLPFLGICRGHQMVQVHAGGKLNQNLRLTSDGTVNHWPENGRHVLAHKVTIDPASPLGMALTMGGFDPSAMKVNSLHHQCVKEPLGDGLRVMATAPDGTIEGLWRPASTFYCSVQWHPELMQDTPTSDILMGIFLSAAKAYRKAHHEAQ